MEQEEHKEEEKEKENRIEIISVLQVRRGTSRLHAWLRRLPPHLSRRSRPCHSRGTFADHPLGAGYEQARTAVQSFVCLNLNAFAAPK